MTIQFAYFTAAWCAPCKQIWPRVEALARRHSIPLDIVDIDERPDHARRLGIMSVPTLIATIDADTIRLAPPSAATLRTLEGHIQEAQS